MSIYQREMIWNWNWKQRVGRQDGNESNENRLGNYASLTIWSCLRCLSSVLEYGLQAFDVSFYQTI